VKPAEANKTLYVGLMSGTSMDGVDSVVMSFESGSITLLATHAHSLPPGARQRIEDISHSGENEIERMGQLDRELGFLFARATKELLDASNIKAQDIAAIGSHGQTIRHRPPSAEEHSEKSFTMQIGDPNTIAEHTGITTIADFRRRDIAAGGEGAPLAPAFHAAAFSRPGVNRAIVNIGGIANVSILQGTELLAGFDTGPGNTLLDHWISHARGVAYDADGSWSAEGKVIPTLLQNMMLHPYLSQSGPRSTGKEAFNMDWLNTQLGELPDSQSQDIQATLAEFTAETIVNGLMGSDLELDEVYVCGGGAHNTDLMRRLYQKLGDTTLDTTMALGMDPDWVEAAAFAWLAHQTLEGLAGNAPVVTGAAGPRVLGGIFPGGTPC